MRPHDDGVLDKLLHTVHQPISIGAWLESTAPFHGVFGTGKVSPSFGDGALVRDGKHPHPAAEDAQRVNHVERLGTSIYLRNGQRPALCRPDGARRKRDPVNLVFEDGSLDVGPLENEPRLPVLVRVRRNSTRVPCCSGQTHMWPSLHLLSSRSSWTFAWSCLTSSFTGNSAGSYTRTSQPRRNRMREAS